MPAYKHFKMAANTNKVTAWKLKRLSDESIKLSLKFDNDLNPGINYVDNANAKLKFDKSCLKQEKLIFTHRTIPKVYIVYEINLWPRNLDSMFTLRNSLLGGVELTKNDNFDNYSYSGYGIRLDPCRFFSLSDNSGIGR